MRIGFFTGSAAGCVTTSAMNRTRRELIAGATALAGLAAVPEAWAGRLLESIARIGPGAFADGVASGDPAATAVTFWSRLTTDRPRSGARLIVAEDEGLRRVVASTIVPTGEAMDHCLKARVGGLAPGTIYHYAWQSGDEISPTGRTRTANHPDSGDAVRIATSSCQRLVAGFFTGHAHAAAQEPYDLVISSATTRTRPRPTASGATRCTPTIWGPTARSCGSTGRTRRCASCTGCIRAPTSGTTTRSPTTTPTTSRHHPSCSAPPVTAPPSSGCRG